MLAAMMMILTQPSTQPARRYHAGGTYNLLITVPVAAKTVKLELPTVSNIPLQTKPENIVISVDSEGKIYWNDGLIPDKTMLLNKLVTAGGQKPQPEVHIRGDANARYEHVGRVVNYCQKAGIIKVGFLTLPVRA